MVGAGARGLVIGFGLFTLASLLWCVARIDVGSPAIILLWAALRVVGFATLLVALVSNARPFAVGAGMALAGFADVASFLFGLEGTMGVDLAFEGTEAAGSAWLFLIGVRLLRGGRSLSDVRWAMALMGVTAVYWVVEMLGAGQWVWVVSNAIAVLGVLWMALRAAGRLPGTADVNLV